jgi:hypothetical protein
MRRFASIAIAMGLAWVACASRPVPSGQEPIDWQAADEHWSVYIVTVDSDGDERVTRIWLAVVDEDGTLRTGDSRWWQNLERDPNCRIRLQGIDYPVRAEFVTEYEAKARIDDAFSEKYGWLNRVMFRQERGETHENYARLRRGMGIESPMRGDALK